MRRFRDRFTVKQTGVNQNDQMHGISGGVGVQCTFSSAVRGNMKAHSKRDHSKMQSVTGWRMNGICVDPDDCITVSAVCKECGESFGDYAEYWKHVKEEHFGGDREWGICNEIGCESIKKMDTRNFMAHLCRHGWSEPWGCNRCGFKTTTKGSMMRHLKGLHGLKKNTSTNDETSDSVQW